jgi:hypothetical protein
MTHRDDLGNVQVDFVWGNLPMQPDDDRLGSVVTPSNVENVGWTQGSLYYGDYLESADYERTLNNVTYFIPADSHSIATTGYSNFPGYIPNYAGDGDTVLTIVPNLVRLTLSEAWVACEKAHLNLFARDHYPTVTGITTTGKTVRVYAQDDNAWGDDPLVGLRAGDQIWVSNNQIDFGIDPVTITARDTVDNAWIEFEAAEEYNYDGPASGNIYAGPNIDNVVTLQRYWNPAGAIVNENRNIHVRYLGSY